MKYAKPPLNVNEQIALLISRGLSIQDKENAGHYLNNISYYRLSAYMLPFQIKDDAKHTFKKGVTFEQIKNLYVFDREFRLLIFDAIERIEIAFRAQLIYHYSLAHGSNWFENESHFMKPEHYSGFVSKLKNELRQTNEVFIRHYTSKYTDPATPPAWMSLEIMSFGQLSKLYKNLKMAPEKKNVSRHFDVHPYVLESWVESLSYVRNICAHHARLWNRTLTVKPTVPTKFVGIWDKQPTVAESMQIGMKVYPLLNCIAYLLQKVNPTSSFRDRFLSLLKQHPDIPVHIMGFPDDWKTNPIWK